jgi:hypothetical protein
MIGAVVDLELARHQWAEGRRALERSGADRAAHSRLSAASNVVVAELTRRVGQTFTLQELADVYEHADRWTIETVDEAFPGDASSAVSVAADAAFDRFSRRASDYAP